MNLDIAGVKERGPLLRASNYSNMVIKTSDRGFPGNQPAF
jgi:hypothetical protein